MTLAIQEPLDSGAMVLASSVVDDANSLITLFPRRTYASSWWWYYCTVTGANGRTVTVDIARANHWNSMLTTTRHGCWAYSLAGPWFDWDTTEFIESPARIRFTAATPFTSGTIHVAYYPVYTWGMVEAQVAEWKASPYVFPTPSADANLVIGTTAARDNGHGRLCPLANLYGFRIEDPAMPGQKNVALITCGVHPGEHPAQWTLLALVEFLLSADADAVALRQTWAFNVYPNVNPQGRYGGLFRNAPDFAADYNRIWAANSSGTLVTVRTAIAADAPVVTLFLDLHCYNHNYGGAFPRENVGLMEGVTTREHPAWETHLLAHDDRYDNIEWPAVTGTINQWVEANLDAGDLTVSATPEAASSVTYGPTHYALYGEDMMRALADATAAGLFPVVSGGPAITSLTPDEGVRGAINLVLTVAGVGFVSGAAATFSGTGITVDSTVFNSATQLTVTIDIDTGATLSAHNVTVTNPDTSFHTKVAAFTVIGTAVAITSVTPTTGAPGATGLVLAVVGSGFAVGCAATFSGTGITVNSTIRNSATSLTVTIDIAADATLSARNVTVTNPDASNAILTSGFTVVVPSDRVYISSFRRPRR